jgi:hypothetical protein
MNIATSPSESDMLAAGRCLAEHLLLHSTVSDGAQLARLGLGLGTFLGVGAGPGPSN